MKKLHCGALVIGWSLLLTGFGPTVPAFGGTPAPEGGGSGSTYIVRFRDGTEGRSLSLLRAPYVARAYRPLTAFPGMVVTLTGAERAALASNPAVEYVEASIPVQVASTQTDPPWGLDRIDQTVPALDGSYTSNQTGSGVKVYVIDTGVNPAHTDFGGRVTAGVSWIDDGLGTRDCHGHGTHVAGTVGGRTFGVAKDVTIVPLRVLGCDGNGTSEDAVRAMDWVVSDHVKGRPAVVNLSLTGGYSRAENDAVKRLVDDGVTVVIAAGNHASDACTMSPGSAPSALTIAASDRADAKLGSSNHGACIDLYAPGGDIRSAAGESGSDTMSGTSMAAPHVAGVAALILGRNPSWSPARITAQIARLSLRDRIGGNPDDTPNRLLNIAPTITGITPPTAGPNGTQTVTITGRGFVDVTGVRFDGKAGRKLKVLSDEKLTVRLPSHAVEGKVTVRVSTVLSDATEANAFRFVAAPTVTGLAPAHGLTSGGAKVVISGTRFVGVRAVYFGDRKASFVVLDEDRIEAIAPGHKAGTVRVRVVTATGGSAASAAARFGYGRVPSVSRLSTGTGLTIGGTRVTLTGKDLGGVTEVAFDGVAGTDLRVRSATSLSVSTPAHAAGTVAVQVTSRFGTSTATDRTRFTYATAPAPTIKRLTPSTGFAAGGTRVTLSGQSFHGVSAVRFGGKEAKVLAVSPTSITVTTPAHQVGEVALTVTGAYGAATSGFTYVATPAPVITKLSRTSGTQRGGKRITITGRHFYSITQVTFGEHVGTELRVKSSTQLTVVTPPSALPGRVDVRVRSPYLSSPASPKARYTFT